ALAEVRTQGSGMTRTSAAGDNHTPSATYKDEAEGWRRVATQNEGTGDRIGGAGESPAEAATIPSSVMPAPEPASSRRASARRGTRGGQFASCAVPDGPVRSRSKLSPGIRQAAVGPGHQHRELRPVGQGPRHRRQRIRTGQVPSGRTGWKTILSGSTRRRETLRQVMKMACRLWLGGDVQNQAECPRTSMGAARQVRARGG
ncbi:hypothetical protein DFR52_1041, partial [Hoeflea marina]